MIHLTGDKAGTSHHAGSCHKPVSPEYEDSTPFCSAVGKSDFTGNQTHLKSTTGFVFYAFGSPVCWNSKKQPTVALLLCKAEYMALAEAAKEAIWLSCFVQGLGYPKNIVKIFGDNHASLLLAKNLIDHQQTKHFI